MQIPSVDDTKLVVLAWFYTISKHWRDRSPQAMLEHVNEITGLPERSSDLVAKYRALQGPALALALTPVPSGLAASMMRYHADPAIKCTETVTCDGCKQLDQKPKHQWDDDELAVHAELTYRIKMAVRALAQDGYMNERPPDMDGGPMPLGEDGLTIRFGITPNGLECARAMCEGGPAEHLVQRRGWEQALTKSEYNKSPAWLRAGG